MVREENREKSSSESKITKFLEGLDDKTPLHLNIKKDPESKNIDNQQPQRNIVDKVENIMNNEEASIEEAIGNNCEEGKMPKNIEEKLSSAVSSIDLADVMDLLRKVDDSVYKSTLQKLLGQANDKMTSLGEGNQKEDLAQIIAFLKNEFEQLSAGNDVEATASSQEAPLVKSKESSPSLSSEEDDFSNLEGNKSDCSAGTSSDSNSNSPF
ncbi:hypothetical protein [Wolbachia endosymbiont (group B) of Camptogramma bilineatum]|uniref:hypothetical protein n=1 Tax=Wolbachia endosymbiont (group B) of Camptogramma bilineatum TaxID=2953991 RepID=UPI0022300ABF|nr:hypothetical protein [Wolbachia endosymbiont (group B) of Camptogramma bilineatum]